MANIDDAKGAKYPGVIKEYAIFWRTAKDHDPNGWRLLGRPTTDHDTLRNMIMPQDMVDGSLYGVGWLDDDGKEFKILERTVIRSEWSTERNR